MKNATLRILAAMLIVCMLLSALSFAAFAAEKPAYSWNAVEYFQATSKFLDADGKIPEISAKLFNSNFNFTTKYADSTNASYKGAGEEYLVYTVNNSASGDAHSYIGIQFNTVAAGKYTVTFDTKSVGAAVTLTIHVASADDFADCPNTSSKTAKGASIIKDGSKKVATINLAKEKENPEDIVFTATLPEKPIIIISGPETGNSKTAIQFTNVSFVKGGSSSAPQPTTPAATEPATEPATTPSTEPSTTPSTEPNTTPATTPSTTAPATNAPTAPADNAGADEGSFPVAAIVAIVVVVLGGAAAGVYFFLKKKNG